MGRRRVMMLSLCAVLLLRGQPVGGRGAPAVEIEQRFQFSGLQSRAIQLTKGDTVEIAAGVESPSKLPANGRVAVEWNTPLLGAGFRKVLHALDPDIFLIYRVPATGSYVLTLRAVEDEEPAFNGPRNTGEAGRLLPEPFDRELREAVERDATFPKLVITPERSRNLAYFRHYVKLNLEEREDAQSCFTCHGSGRVPSMELKALDRRTGFLAAADVWKNYRTLLERIDVNPVERSKLLVKPLNLQTGKEDGHQGGRRYKPGDRGHEILKRWANDVVRLR